jgi:hypothetical protein
MMGGANLKVLGTAVGLLNMAKADLDDEAEAAALYGHATNLMAAIASTPALDFEGAQIKAEAVAWCCASRTDFGLGDTAGERVIGSLLRDLLAAPSP